MDKPAGILQLQFALQRSKTTFVRPQLATDASAGRRGRAGDRRPGPRIRPAEIVPAVAVMGAHSALVASVTAICLRSASKWLQISWMSGSAAACFDVPHDPEGLPVPASSHLVWHSARREFRTGKNYSIYGENSVLHRFGIMLIVRCRTPINSKSMP
jgi:hypothetical protein